MKVRYFFKNQIQDIFITSNKSLEIKKSYFISATSSTNTGENRSKDKNVSALLLKHVSSFAIF